MITWEPKNEVKTGVKVERDSWMLYAMAVSTLVLMGVVAMSVLNVIDYIRWYFMTGKILVVNIIVYTILAVVTFPISFSHGLVFLEYLDRGEDMWND